MATIEQLKQAGVDPTEGLSRCMGMEAFYLRMVEKAVRDPQLAGLRGIVESGDLKAAFEAAHSLKGVTGNLSLGPLYDPLCEMTELLRHRTQADYTPFLDEIDAQKACLLS